MLLHSWTNTKGDLRVELIDDKMGGRCFRLSDVENDVSAVMTRIEAESLRDQLNALLPAQPMKAAA
jgi:hypothetical protein